MDAPTVVGLIGATATGKTGLSIDLARRARADGIGIEILALDSRQLYRGLDVGTGKPTPEERADVPHHLLDRIDVTETPDAVRFREWVGEALDAVWSRGNVAVLVGGAGFYLRALREGFHTIDADEDARRAVRDEVAGLDAAAVDARLHAVDPVTADRLHVNDRYRRGRALEIALLTGRPPSELEEEFEPSPVRGARFDLVHLQWPRPALHERIAARTSQWLDAGWADEVRGLLDAGVDPNAPGLDILGYRDVVAWVRDACDRETAAERIDTGTRRYARAQETWFRKETVRARGEADRAAAALAEAVRAAAA